MFDSDIYKDMAARSGGEIYIGVVGPVRTGKSTLIKRFMTELVLPHADGDRLQEMVDELPQSAAGRTVMTTEPKFIPAKAVKVTVDNAEARVRLIDCVGFAVEGANGFEEDGSPRLVNTMWSDTPIPFTEAAALGTQKVIRDHSTIGLCVTCDGSVAGIPREGYVSAEERTVDELKRIGKPFVIVLNCADPAGASAKQLKEELERKYSAPVVAVNCQTASVDELSALLRAVLFEFPVTSVDVKIPDWIRVMPADSSAISELLVRVRDACAKVEVMRECSLFDEAFANSKFWKGDVAVNLCLATGKATVEVGLQDGVLFDMLSEISGESICGEGALMQYVAAASEAKRN